MASSSSSLWFIGTFSLVFLSIHISLKKDYQHFLLDFMWRDAMSETSLHYCHIIFPSAALMENVLFFFVFSLLLPFDTITRKCKTKWRLLFLEKLWGTFGTEATFWLILFKQFRTCFYRAARVLEHDFLVLFPLVASFSISIMVDIAGFGIVYSLLGLRLHWFKLFLSIIRIIFLFYR